MIIYDDAPSEVNYEDILKFYEMNCTRYKIGVSHELLHAFLTGAPGHGVVSNLPGDAEVVDVSGERYTPYMSNIIVSIPSMPYNRREMEDLQEFRVEYELAK